MPNMRDYLADAQRDYAALLATQELDASKGILFGADGSLAPRSHARTILIGIGGTGVKTIDYVKGVVTKKLQPTWPKYIAFLAIDSDYDELDKAKYLSDDEKLVTTQKGATDRAADRSLRSTVQRRFMPPVVHWGNIEGPGAGCTRLIGKFKIHDRMPTAVGIDVQIANRLQTLVAHKLDKITGLSPDEKYEVYVIGSVCGGTCSGSFIEMPSIIKKALQGKRYLTNAMLYLPDTLASLNPEFKSKMFANGYASLKELDYYQGITMRGTDFEYQELFTVNDDASPEVAVSSFYDVPYMIGTTNPGALDATRVAQETIAEFLISILTEIETTDKTGVFSIASHMDNSIRIGRDKRNYFDPTTKGAEHPQDNHDRPKAYAAVGYSEACAPEKTIRAYSVAKATQTLGLAPVSAAKRDELIAHGVTTMPFLGADELLAAKAGTSKAKEIVEPVSKLLKVIHSGQFDFVADLQQSDVTWERIKAGDFDTKGIQQMGNQFITNQTGGTMMAELDKAVAKAWTEFRKGVQEYVEEFGPFAFVNLYKGNFAAGPDGDRGTGISAMLRNLCSGKTATGGSYGDWKSPTDTRKALDEIRSVINSTNKGWLRGVLNAAEFETQRAGWVEAYNRWMKSRIDNERRNYALTEVGAMWTKILKPSALLCEELEAFGHILVCLTDAYSGMSSSMEDFNKFSNQKDNRTEVNVAAVHNSAYTWLKQKAEGSVASLNADESRKRLVAAFFENPNAWLAIPDNRIRTAGGKVALTVSDVAVPAREEFDKFIVKELPEMIHVSVREMFEQLYESGISYEETANRIVTDLIAGSKPQFNGAITADYIVVVYPSDLNEGANGAKIVAALKNAVTNAFVNAKPQIYSSADAGRIRMYQLAAPFELYKLNDLTEWERNYEAFLGDEGAGLHGFSPDVKVTTDIATGNSYTERLRWADYPAITLQTGDPRQKNPNTGKVSTEGRRRLEMDKIIDRARELGVLFAEETSEGWIVKRFHCDKTIEWNRFDVISLTADPKTNLLPLGRDLAQAVAEQHGKTLDEVTKPVSLVYGGIFATARKTQELAWEAARRVLYSHMPMYIEIRDTLKEHFEKWCVLVEQINKVRMERLKPAKMLKMIRALRLYRKPDGIWVLKQPNGSEKNLAALTDAMKQFLLPRDKFMVNNGLLGYFLYTKLLNALPGDALDSYYEFACRAYQEMQETMNLDDLTAGMNAAAFVEQEALALDEAGARLPEIMSMDDADADMSRFQFSERFLTAMRPSGLSSDELKEVVLFYTRARKEL